MRVFRLVNVLIEKLDTTAAIIGIFLGLVALIISEHYSLNRDHICLIILISSAFYLILNKKKLLPESSRIGKSFLLLTSLFSFIFLINQSIFKFFIDRNYILYFISIAFSCLIIAVQILSLNNAEIKNIKISIIIIEILSISLVVCGNSFFEYFTVYGVDPFYHIRLIEYIEKTGYIGNFSKNYANFPIFHIYICIFELITDTGLKISYFIVGIVTILSSIFVFLIGRKLFDAKVGLLSMLIFSISDYHMVWSTSIIPMSYGLSIFIIIIYIVMEYLCSGKKHSNLVIINRFLLILFSGVIIITHSICSFIVFVAFLSIYFGINFNNLILDNKLINRIKPANQFSNLSHKLIVLYFLLFLYYWIVIYAEGVTFFDIILISLRRGLISMEIGEISKLTTSIALPSITIALNDFGQVLLLGLSIIGILFSLGKLNRNSIGFAFVTLIIVFYFIIYVPSIFNIDAILPSRWFAFLYAFLSLYAACALIFVLRLDISLNLKRSLIILYIFLLIFFMVSTPKVTSHAIYSRELVGTSGFNESEVLAANFALTKYPDIIMTTANFWLILNRFDAITGENPKDIILNNDTIYKYTNKLLVIPMKSIGGYISSDASFLSTRVFLSQEFLNFLDNSYQKIYINGYVSIWQRE